MLNYTVLCPFDVTLNLIDDAYHFRAEVIEYIGEHVHAEYHHDYFAGSSRFAFADGAEALAFADAFDGLLYGPETAVETPSDAPADDGTSAPIEAPSDGSSASGDDQNGHDGDTA